MRFYGTGFQDILGLPVRAFWSLNGLINRVRAEEILDWLPAHTSAMGGDGVKKLVNQLEQRVGTPFVFEQKGGIAEKDIKALQRHFG